MNMALPKRGLARHAAALIASAAAVALVTASIFALDSFAPVLSLGVLYVFAVLPVAVLFGLAYALPVSVASMLAFNWFFLPPTAHASAERLRELGRARRLPRHRGRRERARRALAAPRGGGARTRARGVAPGRGRRGAARERARPGASCGASRSGSPRHSASREARIELDSVRRPEQRRVGARPERRRAQRGPALPRGRARSRARATGSRPRSPRCWPSRSTASDSAGGRSRPRPCAEATRSRPRSCARSATTCARR